MTYTGNIHKYTYFSVAKMKTIVVFAVLESLALSYEDLTRIHIVQLLITN